MKQIFYLLFSILFFPLQLLAVQPNSNSIPVKNDSILTRQLQQLFTTFHGDVGIYVENLKTRKTVEINADKLYPTASMIKVPILLTIFEQIHRDSLQFDQLIEYKGKYGSDYGQDILNQLKPGAKLPMGELVHLMITLSDNSASLLLQHVAGTGTAINQWLAKSGYKKTRVNARTRGREANYKEYGWGQTTPREMASILTRIYQGKMVSKAASEKMFRILSNSYWDGEALSQIPPYINAASKQGAVNASRSEVVLVNAPSGDYVFCLITKNQEDQSWNYDNEGFVLLRKASSIIWKHFEPDTSWSPPEEMKKYW